MKFEFTTSDVVSGFEALGITKTPDEVKTLNEKYRAMASCQEKFDRVNGALKIKIGQLESLFNKLGITFSYDDVFATAYFNGVELCKCEQEWAEIYDVTIATLDKILKTFTAESHTEESQKLKDKWYDEFYFSGVQLVLQAALGNLKSYNDEINKLWKKSMDFQGELMAAQSEFYSLEGSRMFEKYFGKRMLANEELKVTTKGVAKNVDINEVKELFKQYGVFIANKDLFEDFAYIVDEHGVEFLCRCDAKYNFIVEKALRTLEGIKKDLEENNVFASEHWKRHFDYFFNLDIKKLRKELEKLEEKYGSKSDTSSTNIEV